MPTGRAIFITRHRGPEVLQEREFPVPEPGPGRVLIECAATGVNFTDVFERFGLYDQAPSPPFVPGFEVSGVVLRTGEGVIGLTPGDRIVAVTRFGGYVSLLDVPAAHCLRMPAAASFEEGAALAADAPRAAAPVPEGILCTSFACQAGDGETPQPLTVSTSWDRPVKRFRMSLGAPCPGALEIGPSDLPEFAKALHKADELWLASSIDHRKDAGAADFPVAVKNIPLNPRRIMVTYAGSDLITREGPVYITCNGATQGGYFGFQDRVMFGRLLERVDQAIQELEP